MDSDTRGIGEGGHEDSSSLNPVEPPETAITVGECFSGGDGDLEAGPGAAPAGGKTSAGRDNGGAVAAAAAVVSDTDKAGYVVVDVKCVGLDGGEDDEYEKVCRICHLSPDCRQAGRSELIQLGCGCKADLGSAHRRCAEAWFNLRGNRYCEICGACAKNLTGVEDVSFMEEWNDRRVLGGGSTSTNSSERERCWRGQSLCNLLMACLVIAFILPWFFRISMF